MATVQKKKHVSNLQVIQFSYIFKDQPFRADVVFVKAGFGDELCTVSDVPIASVTFSTRSIKTFSDISL